VCACEHAHRLSSSPARPPSRPGAHASRALRHTLGAAARQGVRHGSMECSGAPDRLLEPQRFVCACKHAHWLSSRLSSVGPSSPGRWPRPLPPEALRPGLGGAMRAPPLQLAAQLHARCTSRLEGRLVRRCPRVAQRVRSRGPRPAEGVLRVRLGLLRHVDDARKGRRETVAGFCAFFWRGFRVPPRAHSQADGWRAVGSAPPYGRPSAAYVTPSRRLSKTRLAISSRRNSKAPQPLSKAKRVGLDRLQT
jgi:hypothetical protein